MYSLLQVFKTHIKNNYLVEICHSITTFFYCIVLNSSSNAKKNCSFMET